MTDPVNAEDDLVGWLRNTAEQIRGHVRAPVWPNPARLDEAATALEACDEARNGLDRIIGVCNRNDMSHRAQVATVGAIARQALNQGTPNVG